MSLKDGKNALSSYFEGTDTFEEASIIIVGAPMDFTSSFKPGSRFGPQKIREVSVSIEEYNVFVDKSLSEVKYFDYGDLELPFGNVITSLGIIREAAYEILDSVKVPVFIGGEHLISLPIIKEMYRIYGESLILLHFDAHTDLRKEYLGCQNSHASVIRRIAHFMPNRNIYQFGIRSGTKEEFLFAKANTNLYFEVLKPLKKVIQHLGNRPVYVTLDIDVVDPAYANGTGTPDPGGITSNEILEAIRLLMGVNVVGFDLVEVAPLYDSSDRTALLAAKIIRDMLFVIDHKIKCFNY